MNARDKTLIDVFRRHCGERSATKAYSFLDSGVETTLSYGDLDARARHLATVLHEVVGPGERVLLLYPPGLEFVIGFVGCLYAGVVAVPAYPPNPSRLQRTLPRLLAIARDASPRAALTTAAILPLVQKVHTQMPELASLKWIASDAVEDRVGDWKPSKIGADDLAVLQYTSGSTAAPKGVMLTHRDILYNLQVIHERFETTTESRGVFWLPLYHDMGLIGGLLETAYCGGSATLLSPLTFLRFPMLWLQTLSRDRADIGGGPNFAFELCLQRSTPETCEQLDLSSWTLAFIGAEPVRKNTIERFAEAFAPCGFRREAFYPCYGLAEATLLVTGGKRAEPSRYITVDSLALAAGKVIPMKNETASTRTFVGCGHVGCSSHVVIVEPESRRPVGVSEVGEIWVAHPHMASGYWGQPEATEKTFNARLVEGGTNSINDEREGDSPFLRTGDLGFVIDDELFVTGRLKDLIVFAGRNVYPLDVERAAEESHAAVRHGCSAAFAVEIADEERIVLAVEVDRSYSCSNGGAELVRRIQQAVLEREDLRLHEVLLLAPGAMPKTSSGKVQRHACKAGFLKKTLTRLGTNC